jgi:hypothetical protein
MVHVAALPGTARNSMKIDAIISEALRETLILTEGGIDAVMIENMHDRPYLNRNVGPEVVAAMTAVAIEIRQAFKIPQGIQILAGANKEALAVALAAGFDFIRAEGFVFVTKLRKFLSDDPNIEIKNIHGSGFFLEVK